MNKKQQIETLEQLVVKYSVENGLDLKDRSEKSRITYLMVSSYRNITGKRPTQAVIDAVRFC